MARGTGGVLGPNGAGKSTTLKDPHRDPLSHLRAGGDHGLHPVEGPEKVCCQNRCGLRPEIPVGMGYPPIDAFYLNKEIYAIPEREFKRTMDEMVELLDLADLIRNPPASFPWASG